MNSSGKKKSYIVFFAENAKDAQLQMNEHVESGYHYVSMTHVQGENVYVVMELNLEKGGTTSWWRRVAFLFQSWYQTHCACQLESFTRNAAADQEACAADAQADEKGNTARFGSRSRNDIAVRAEKAVNKESIQTVRGRVQTFAERIYSTVIANGGVGRYCGGNISLIVDPMFSFPSAFFKADMKCWIDAQYYLLHKVCQNMPNCQLGLRLRLNN